MTMGEAENFFHPNLTMLSRIAMLLFSAPFRISLDLLSEF